MRQNTESRTVVCKETLKRYIRKHTSETAGFLGNELEQTLPAHSSCGVQCPDNMYVESLWTLSKLEIHNTQGNTVNVSLQDRLARTVRTETGPGSPSIVKSGLLDT